MFIDVRFDPLEGQGGRLLAASAEGLAGAWRQEPAPSCPASVASPTDFACRVVRTPDGAVAYHALTFTRAPHRVIGVRATFVGPRAAMLAPFADLFRVAAAHHCPSSVLHYRDATGEPAGASPLPPDARPALAALLTL